MDAVDRPACCAVSTEIREGELIFRIVETGEVDRLREVRRDISPLRDQPLVDGVELIGVGKLFFEPRPLDDGRLEQGGRRVGVVFEQLRRPGAVEGYIEASVEGRRFVLPGPLDRGDGFCGNLELGVTLPVDDVLGGFEAHLLQRRACRFERVDLCGGEFVASGLVPVRTIHSSVLGRMKDESRRSDLLLPVIAWTYRDTPHYSPPPWPDDIEPPKPPRVVTPDRVT